MATTAQPGLHNESRPSTTSCTPTITTAATPHSEANHQPTPYLTSVDRTPRVAVVCMVPDGPLTHYGWQVRSWRGFASLIVEACDAQPR
jgi:hypothetical protein